VLDIVQTKKQQGCLGGEKKKKVYKNINNFSFRNTLKFYLNSHGKDKKKAIHYVINI
jgi:hypothetical protein